MIQLDFKFAVKQVNWQGNPSTLVGLFGGNSPRDSFHPPLNSSLKLSSPNLSSQLLQFLRVCSTGIEPGASTPPVHSVPSPPLFSTWTPIYVQVLPVLCFFPPSLLFSPMWHLFHPHSLSKGKLFKTVPCSFQSCTSFSVLGCKKSGNQLATGWGWGVREAKFPFVQHGWS